MQEPGQQTLKALLYRSVQAREVVLAQCARFQALSLVWSVLCCLFWSGWGVAFLNQTIDCALADCPEYYTNLPKCQKWYPKTLPET